MTAYILGAVLIVVVLGAAKYWILPLLWRSISDPGINQDECRAGSQLDKSSHSASGVVRTIRLTDDGEFVDRCELTDVIYEIRNCGAPELVVWYIHGWKHSAASDDSDLQRFTRLISDLNGAQSCRPAESRRHVIGVYVAWDGAVGPRVLRHATFWNRKRAADRISQSSILTKIIAAAKYARRQKEPAITEHDVTIMIGHSFGARILYTATAQGLADEVQRCHPGFIRGSYQVIGGPADLILLLNPAMEASVFTAMHSVRRPDSKKWESIAPLQQPRLLAITTENDWATRLLFPWGQWLEFARRDRQLKALGHYEEYITHTLRRVKSGDQSSANSGFWYDHFEAGDLRLLNVADRQPGNPFLNVRTQAEVIDGHNGIWGEALRTWMVAFLSDVQNRTSVSARHVGDTLNRPIRD